MNVKELNAQMRETYHAAGYTGKGVVFAVLDLGVKPVGALKGKVTGDTEDNSGHGTFVAEQLIKYCPDAEIWAYYCLWPDDMTSALKDVVKRAAENPNKRVVVNMSLATDSDSITDAVNACVAAGIPLVCAASNDGEERHDLFPSCLESPITVTACDEGARPAYFNTWHEEVDFCDYGVMVAGMGLDGGRDMRSGTSFASPQIAGKIGLLLSVNPTMTEPEIYEALKSMAHDLESVGRDPFTGNGFVELAAPKSIEKPKEEEQREDAAPTANSITNKQLVEKFKQFEREGWGYVYGAQGELYTKELAQKWHERAKAGSKSVPSGRNKASYFVGDCSRWIGKHVADCSGGIVYAIQQYIPTFADRTADGFKAQFTKSGVISTIPEIPGLAVWRKGHIGVYVGGGYVIEFRGTDYGCVKTKLSERNFTHWGMIKGVTYEVESNKKPYYGVCTGGSVNVRSGGSILHKIVGVAKKDDKLLVNPTDGWPEVAVVLNGKITVGYMSDKYVKKI